MSRAAETWYEANRRYLAAALAELRTLLAPEAQATPANGRRRAKAEKAQTLAAAMSPPPALESLSASFGLAPFERALLLLCAGVELDPALAALCASASGDATAPRATFAFALDRLPGADWSALAPAAALRRWRMIEVGPGPTLMHSPLRIDERVLFHLLGEDAPDHRLAGLLENVPPAGELPPSQQDVAERASRALAAAGGQGRLPALLLAGADRPAQRAVAAAACASLGLRLFALSAQALPVSPNDLEDLQRLWEREAMLSGGALLLENDSGEPPDPARQHALRSFVDRTAGLMLLAGGRQWPEFRRPTLRFDVAKPRSDEQVALWQAHLGPVARRLNGELEHLVGQFDLESGAIRAACDETLARMPGGAEDEAEPPTLDPSAIHATLWERCRAQSRPPLDELAQRIEPAVAWEDLILPAAQRDILQNMAKHVRQQRKVYETWGFAGKGRRGLGISALFAGASGTGKTMAAEVLAHELRLDLYRIDLSAVVSKYIGETEKNLRRIFDAAESGGVILLFDEADALFGKRSEVKDSHDRHANIEVSYLLQRMEAYRGLAILTTNMKEALDPAFLRRIRFVVLFPFPDAAQRAEIWRSVFPAATPTEGLDPARLAQLHVAGGHIRNIALQSAFAAADEGSPVRMEHLLLAARGEYLKMEKALTENETRGWGG
jgi:hypothetical protein